MTLLPAGLAKKRHWSKKYPICVTLNKNQMDFGETTVEEQIQGPDGEEVEGEKIPKRKFAFGGVEKKRKTPVVLVSIVYFLYACILFFCASLV